MTVFGAIKPGKALRRDAACVDDEIWVSGELGAADVAYRMLDGQLPADPQLLSAVRRALEWPMPRLALGRALAGLAHAAIDISDGLLQDLGHILDRSQVGAELRDSALPVAAGLEGLDLATATLPAPGGLGDLPLTVLTAGRDEWAPGFPSELARSLREDWLAMQGELLGLSRVGRQEVLPHSGHCVHVDDSLHVIESILALTGH